MTLEQQKELMFAGKSWNYQLGREQAMEDISKGLLDGFAACTDLVAVMGEEWVNGYREYLNAWKVLNA